MSVMSKRSFSCQTRDPCGMLVTRLMILQSSHDDVARELRLATARLHCRSMSPRRVALPQTETLVGDNRQ